MHTRTKRIGIAVLIILVIAGIVLFAVRTGKESAPLPDVAKENPPAVGLSYTYKKGILTITGTITVPTPCHTISATASEPSSGTVRIDVDAPADDGMCVQVVTEKTFSVSVKTAKGTTAEVYVNGTKATTSS